MSIENKHIMENIRITPLDLLKALGSLVCELPKLHLLSPVSEHFSKDPHPFDAELYDGQQEFTWVYPDDRE